MTFSQKNPAWNRMHSQRYDRLVELEKQRAKALQEADPSLTWGQALKLATAMPVKRQAG